MKVAIVSDTHFGYGWDTDREGDCFRNAAEAFERTQDADLVILPGDIYDKKVPKQEVLSRSIDCFNIYRDSSDSPVELTADSDVDYTFTGTPVVAIHGTHERRTKGFVNPIELLEKLGYLLHLHNEVAVFEHPETGEKVAVHGMSGVPERYAPKVLEKFAPEPVEDAYNIFVFHQSVKDFVYTDQDHDVLKLEHLPDGFDLLVDGHIHWYNLEHVDADKPFILPGSTLSTQMRKIEAEKPKGFVTVDTDTDDVEFHALESARELFHEEIDVSGMSSAEIMDAIDTRIDAVTADTGERRPLVRLIITGETAATVSQAEIRDRYADDAVLSLSIRTSDTIDTGDAAATLEERSQSIQERGRQLLHQQIDRGSTQQIDTLFDLLAAEQTDDAVEHVEQLDIDEMTAPETDADDTADVAVEQDDTETGADATAQSADTGTDTIETGADATDDAAPDDTAAAEDEEQDSTATGVKSLDDFS